MKIAIGSDHGGFLLKNALIEELKQKGYNIEDFGTYTEESCDYPDIAKVVAKKVAKGEFTRGILICGTGIGMSIAANKTPGIRAALCHDVYSAQMTRRHNDSNILCLGERVIGPGLASLIVETWLTEEFEGGRHQIRIDKI
ncbi:MAG: ribose 5-phosphate isomerase B [Firmicutes bacterium]|jgi:ribose 5-phosphate isomerase B|nr:ribose 5-phosphate isomerase B [Bacillota bacterium]